MNPTEPSSEETLRAAFDPVPDAVESDQSERLRRLRSGLQAQTAIHDVCHLLVDHVAAVLGWISLTLLKLVLPDAEKPPIKENERDEHQ
jgi:hypothetical protein